jgi:hypothetical protein
LFWSSSIDKPRACLPAITFAVLFLGTTAFALGLATVGAAVLLLPELLLLLLLPYWVVVATTFIQVVF